MAVLTIRHGIVWKLCMIVAFQIKTGRNFNIVRINCFVNNLKSRIFVANLNQVHLRQVSFRCHWRFVIVAVVLGLPLSEAISFLLYWKSCLNRQVLLANNFAWNAPGLSVCLSTLTEDFYCSFFINRKFYVWHECMRILKCTYKKKKVKIYLRNGGKIRTRIYAQTNWTTIRLKRART